MNSNANTPTINRPGPQCLAPRFEVLYVSRQSVMRSHTKVREV